jgi:RimJ/RimL family protein N-acetyltransferase
VLEPLAIEHLEPLVQAASGDRSTFGFTTVPDGADAMGRYIEGLLDQRRNGEVLAFVQRRRADNVVVGCTRFMNLQSWSGRTEPDEVEVGGTWLSAAAQRSAVNTDAKLLMLGHAFETWQVQRVELCTDARNTRSRAAIERLGATFEGVLRSHRFSHVASEAGQARDSAVFSIIAAEWPAVRGQLVQRLDVGHA